MIKTMEEIHRDLVRMLSQDTGNVVETLVTYQVKQRQVEVVIEKTVSGRSLHYMIVMKDYETGDNAEAEILFQEYPRKCIDHSTIVGNNRIYMQNSGIRKNFRDILKAIAMIYRVGVEKQHI